MYEADEEQEAQAADIEDVPPESHADSDDDHDRRRCVVDSDSCDDDDYEMDEYDDDYEL